MAVVLMWYALQLVTGTLLISYVTCEYEGVLQVSQHHKGSDQEAFAQSTACHKQYLSHMLFSPTTHSK
jgi:hypothetical protein